MGRLAEPRIRRPIDLVIEGRVLFRSEIFGSFDRPGRVSLFVANDVGEFRKLQLKPVEFTKEREFVFHPRAPGEYRVQYDLGFWWAPGVDGNREYASNSVLVRPGEIVRVDIEVGIEPPYVGGTVTDRVTGEPKVGVPVVATSRCGRGAIMCCLSGHRTDLSVEPVWLWESSLPTWAGRSPIG